MPMVLEMTCPDENLLFVRSSEDNKIEADTEILRWARARGYHLLPEDHAFMTYEGGALLYEWRLLERQAASQQAA